MKNTGRVMKVLARVAAFGLLCGALVVPQVSSYLTSSRGATDRSGVVSPDGIRGAQFKMSGKVGGLYPGVPKKIKVAVTNPNRFKIKVVKIAAVTKRPDKAGCPRTTLKPKKSVRVNKIIKPRRKLVVKYPVKLSATAPSACQGARWPLKYKGSAVKK